MNDPIYGARWVICGIRRGWPAHSAPKWKRLPIIRHLRVLGYILLLTLRRKHYEVLGYEPNGYDDWVLAGMWRGWEFDA